MPHLNDSLLALEKIIVRLNANLMQSKVITWLFRSS